MVILKTDVKFILTPREWINFPHSGNGHSGGAAQWPNLAIARIPNFHIGNECAKKSVFKILEI